MHANICVWFLLQQKQLYAAAVAPWHRVQHMLCGAMAIVAIYDYCATDTCGLLAALSS